VIGSITGHHECVGHQIGETKEGIAMRLLRRGGWMSQTLAKPIDPIA
jgi:hypothetical protein